jgi:hypothetical protein
MKTEFSCVYIHRPKQKVSLSKTFDPFDITFVRRYIPKHWDKRIIAQGGLFTVHNDPYTPWNPAGLIKVFIHHDVRKAIKKTLNRYGVNVGVIYPDIEGVARHVKWLQSDNH